MSSDSGSPGSAPELPPLGHRPLDQTSLLAHWKDLEELTEIQEVRCKGGAMKTSMDATVSFAEGTRLFIQEMVQGLQIRYRYDNIAWVDTYLRTPRGVQLIRMEDSHSIDVAN